VATGQDAQHSAQIRGSFKNKDKLQSVAFKETTARYVRLVALSVYHDGRKAAIAELDLLSSKPQNPKSPNP